jgi:hypothetical protein
MTHLNGNILRTAAQRDARSVAGLVVGALSDSYRPF